jgi:hypothetical protein
VMVDWGMEGFDRSYWQLAEASGSRTFQRIENT